MNLRIALHGASLVDLAGALAKLDGVRVTGGPEGAGRQRCYLVHCPGFKMVLSCPTAAAGEAAEFAHALVSRLPQAALAVMSDLGSLLERLMNEPPPLVEPTPAKRHGKPLARKTELRRKTPLARGRFKRR